MRRAAGAVVGLVLVVGLAGCDDAPACPRGQTPVPIVVGSVPVGQYGARVPIFATVCA